MSVRDLLERLRAGDVGVEAVLAELAKLPVRDMGFAKIDGHRELRQGVPEVVFGQGKTALQIAEIAKALFELGQNVLVTRLDRACADEVRSRLPAFAYHELGRIGRLDVHAVAPRVGLGPVAVVTAGTSDIPVAEEAAVTLDAVGLPVDRHYDVGVAGIHRVLHREDDLGRASAVIVIAGMEGALPSVVGGLVRVPVIAVPTSIGYGTALGGFTPLFAMLTSCASGVTVVNIDNGFGAALAVHRLASAWERRAPVKEETA
jgi:hypothetical protein